MPTVTGKQHRAVAESIGDPLTTHCDSADSEQRPATEHLKRVPRPKLLREQLRQRATAAAGELDPVRGVEKPELESVARRLLAELSLPDGFVGWTMVMLASALWQSQVMAVPIEQRLLLLPGDLPHVTGCAGCSGPANGVNGGAGRRLEAAATTNGGGADCSACGVVQLRAMAERLGYRVLWAGDHGAVLNALFAGEVEAVVVPLDLLGAEPLDEILRFDIPCMAVPLLGPSGDEKAGAEDGLAFDVDWVRQMIELPHAIAADGPPNYRHLARAARRMFEPDELERLAPRAHGGPTLTELNGQGAAGLDPIGGTEAIAFDFLVKGGKYSRPFITLAVYDAMTGGRCAATGGRQQAADLPLAVRRAALSIETFHKASLVHDDIEDDDPFRYGEPTLHRKFGAATAINVGDYLIGLGYRLVSRERGTLGAEVVGDILDQLADAHLKLAEGQGAELFAATLPAQQLTPAEALGIYALKTAPAFDAALLTGLRLAAPIEPYVKLIGEFARNLGVAFQIRNDLGDWETDDHNRLIATGDVLGGRPTLLWALACEGLDAADRARLDALAARQPTTESTVRQIGRLYHAAEVFDKAERLVAEYEEQARAVAAAIEPAQLRRLLRYLIDVVLRPRASLR